MVWCTFVVLCIKLKRVVRTPACGIKWQVRTSSVSLWRPKHTNEDGSRPSLSLSRPLTVVHSLYTFSVRTSSLLCSLHRTFLHAVSNVASIVVISKFGFNFQADHCLHLEPNTPSLIRSSRLIGLQLEIVPDVVAVSPSPNLLLRQSVLPVPSSNLYFYCISLYWTSNFFRFCNKYL